MTSSVGDGFLNFESFQLKAGLLAADLGSSSMGLGLLLSLAAFLTAAAVAAEGRPAVVRGLPTYALSSAPSPSPSPSPSCFPSLFSFGDSKADTGNFQAAFPFESRSENAPYGRTYFGRPSDRYCDGRLAIDFQAQAYGLPFLSPYLKGLGSEFRHGANFAVSGSGALPNLTSSPFDLGRQFRHFKRLKNNYHAYAREHALLPPSSYFGEGLYVISTGENDYRDAIVYLQLSAEDIKATLVPSVVESINFTIKGLYEEGARKFLVVGIAADGCISRLLSLLSNETLDEFGCVMAVNDYVQHHNLMLFDVVKQLRVALPEAEIGFADYFGANIQILMNATNYGFDEPFKACCGIGGEYNFNQAVQCGQTGEVDGEVVTAVTCENPSKYINWDGIHLTEHFYELVANAFIEGHFVDEPPSCSLTCSLDCKS